MHLPKIKHDNQKNVKKMKDTNEYKDCKPVICFHGPFFCQVMDVLNFQHLVSIVLISILFFFLSHLFVTLLHTQCMPKKFILYFFVIKNV